MVILWFICTVRFAYVLCEQPGSSVMPGFPYVVYFQKLLSKYIPWQLAKLPEPQTRVNYLDRSSMAFDYTAEMKVIYPRRTE